MLSRRFRSSSELFRSKKSAGSLLSIFFRPLLLLPLDLSSFWSFFWKRSIMMAFRSTCSLILLTYSLKSMAFKITAFIRFGHQPHFLLDANHHVIDLVLVVVNEVHQLRRLRSKVFGVLVSVFVGLVSGLV